MVIDFSHNDDMKKIEKKFMGMGWRNFFRVTKDAVYDALVCQFYGNLTHSSLESYVITSIVDGYELVLNKELLREILRVPAKGKRIYCSKRWDKKNTGVSFAQAMDIIIDSPIDPLRSPKPSLEFTNQMTKTMGKIVKMAIMPRLGNLSKPNYNEMNILFHLKMGLPLNLPFLILNHMIELAKNSQLIGFAPWANLKRKTERPLKKIEVKKKSTVAADIGKESKRGIPFIVSVPRVFLIDFKLMAAPPATACADHNDLIQLSLIGGDRYYIFLSLTFSVSGETEVEVFPSLVPSPAIISRDVIAPTDKYRESKHAM
ncbi:hypothetical protein L6164_002695 [Bauhinia variegata]|uniref:Uncharacterized protein n=1 Tax=Bauhinia variegata TaxID=167791 RepID=A0ACB9PYU9_BAUVA|nr:hypothetical protein L6164_002695 [Bauhinia variegata]